MNKLMINIKFIIHSNILDSKSYKNERKPLIALSCDAFYNSKAFCLLLIQNQQHYLVALPIEVTHLFIKGDNCLVLSYGQMHS